MKKGLIVILSDDERNELQRVMDRNDADGALQWLNARLKGKARDLLEGG